VPQGTTLFSLRSRDASQAVEDHVDAVRDLDLAEKTLALTQDLFDHDAASRIALEQAQSDLAKAKARLARADDALSAIGLRRPDDPDATIDPRIPVTSPIAGTVIERHANDGQYVQPDPSPLLVIADLSQVWVEADVFERDLHLLRTGQSATVTTTAYPDEQFVARVDRISDLLDPATRAAKVRFVVANHSAQLKPEMFANVALLVDEQEQALAIPASAVITDGDQTFVYVEVDAHTFARRSVEVSADTHDLRRVLHGLAVGDRVVTAGAVQLRAQETGGAD
jgi:cobalt-zinc-cadmium efflux system membrane fusion protein